MRIDAIPLSDEAGWRAALERVPHAFAHSWDSCRAHSLTTGYVTSLLHLTGGEVDVVCPVAERPIDGHRDVVTPYGFSGFSGTGPCPALPHLLRTYARDREWVCGYFGLSPVLHHPSYGTRDSTSLASHLYVLDLTLPRGELFRRLSTNRRRQLRGWEPDLHSRDDPEVIEFFISQYPPFMERRGASGQYAFTRETLEALCRAPGVLLLGARVDGDVVAASMFASSPYAGDFLFGVSLPGSEGHSAGLIWSAAHQLAEMGVPTLNLGGGVRPDDSLAEFKARFGGDRVPFLALKEVFRPAVYDELCRKRGVDPDDHASYFPPYRSR